MRPFIFSRYYYWRSHGLPASAALAWARTEEDYARNRATFGDWEFGRHDYGAFASAEREESGYTLRLLIGNDDQPVDWGDCEPSDREREHASAYYVALQVIDPLTQEEMHHDGIGGVDVIDLPGYMQRDWEDAAAYALTEYLLDGALDFARTEAGERAHWAARDTITL